MTIPKFSLPFRKGNFTDHGYQPVILAEKGDAGRESSSLSSRDDLSDSTLDHECLISDPEDHIPPPRTTTRRTLLILHGSLIFFNLLIAALILFPYDSRTPFSASARYELDSIKSVIKYQSQRWGLSLGEYTEYTKPPSPEVDEEWNKISASPGHVGFVIVQKDELERKDLVSTPLADGSGYLATLDVFHEIHCLDYLRRQIFNESYYHMSTHTQQLQTEHIAHCIDSLLLYIKCHADTSLVPFRWIRGFPAPWPDFRSTHQCRNFDDILAFAQKEQKVYNAKLEDQGAAMFIHPEMGIFEGKAGHNPLAGGKEIVYLDGN